MKIKPDRIFAVLTCALAVLFFFACKSAKPDKAQESAEEKTAFFTLVLHRDSIQKKTKAEVNNVNVVDTKVRYRADENKVGEPYYLKITVTYKNGKAFEVLTEHPLYKRVEIYSESGKIESKLISLSQGELTFRMPYFGEQKQIAIVEIVNFKELQPLILKK